MSEYPPGVDRDDLLKALTAGRDFRLRAVLEHLNPRAVTITLWCLVEMDMAAALQRISEQEYKALADYGRKKALKTIKEWTT